MNFAVTPIVNIEVEIFTTVMTKTNPVTLNALGKFVNKEFKRREQEARYDTA